MEWGSMETVLQGLNPAQREAVETLEGPLLILAGPGSGKTRVVTHRIANLLSHGVWGREILALTFTNKAAEEMGNRVRQLVPDAWVRTSTFHRFCARLLREYGERVGLRSNFTIFDADDSHRLVRTIVSQEGSQIPGATPGAVAEEISRAKSSLITPDQYKPRQFSVVGELATKIYPLYQQRLIAANAVDFDDLLLHVVTMLRTDPELRATLDRRWRFVMVDEYQDTNLAQYAIAKLLSVDHPNLAVTGDPDQSIYGWRGADLRNILDFENDYPDAKIVRLEQNYRSTPQILQVAQSLISHNVKRKRKELYTENETGVPVRFVTYNDSWDEARSIADRIKKAVVSQKRRFRDFAVFYRMNSFSRAIELAMRDRGIPTQIVGGVAFFQRAEVKDLLAYARVLLNPWDDVSLLRIINNPPRGIGKTTLNRVMETASRRGKTMLETLREIETIGVAKRTETAIHRFLETYDVMEKNFRKATTLETLLRGILTDSGYGNLFANDSEEAIQRRSNLDELLVASGEFDSRYENPIAAANEARFRGGDGENFRTPNETNELPVGSERLEQFLEDSALAAAQDSWEDETNRVTLMTLHASKGLEFPAVFIVGVEQGVLPHERSSYSEDQLEEERRLLFVGITRAKEELELSVANYRETRGMRQMMVPSSFLMELPRGDMDIISPKSRWTTAEVVLESSEEELSNTRTLSPSTKRKRRDGRNGIRTEFNVEEELESECVCDSDDGCDPGYEEVEFSWESGEEIPKQTSKTTSKSGRAKKAQKKGRRVLSETSKWAYNGAVESPEMDEQDGGKIEYENDSDAEDDIPFDIPPEDSDESAENFVKRIPPSRTPRKSTVKKAKSTANDKGDERDEGDERGEKGERDEQSEKKAKKATPKKLSQKQRILQERRAERVTGESRSKKTLAEMPVIQSDTFAIGMKVFHPKRGIGEIVDLSSRSDGDDRTVTLRFPKPPLRETYRLSETPLRVVSKKGKE